MSHRAVFGEIGRPFNQDAEEIRNLPPASDDSVAAKLVTKISRGEVADPFSISPDTLAAQGVSTLTITASENQIPETKVSAESKTGTDAEATVEAKAELRPLFGVAQRRVEIDSNGKRTETFGMTFATDTASAATVTMVVDPKTGMPKVYANPTPLSAFSVVGRGFVVNAQAEKENVFDTYYVRPN